MSWKGLLDAGAIRIDFAPKDHPKPGSYVVRSSSRSLGPAASLFPYDATFWSEIHPSKLIPNRFFATEKDRREMVESKTIFTSQRAETTETTRTHGNKKSQTRLRAFDFHPTHDLFSAMLFVRSQRLAKDDRLALVVHPFGTPYLVRIHVAGHENHQDQSAIHLKVSMHKINRDTLRLEPYKKMKRQASLWLSNDKRRIPLELRASVFIGDVRATLVGK